ncbi:LysR family transcriptional regulator [Devosia nitrariae]|uniref:LysR family transcriptional regulator n=1 Tax=Devosia nitrariae TaxID=2071872 RepID=A0ABQ5W2U1_9HYPH|nr:LysR family transcriptional regulator [Devosia nitrariae]GLQ54297.1 LysR family transcriptional regulator [Devosia nitrariae]
MTRAESNRSGEMEILVRVVKLGGFSAAARACRMSPSAVSKLVTRLEGRLGTRLFNRSTRKLQLTPEGALFYQRCMRILADIAEAEREAGAGAAARGRVRINSNVPFGRHYLLPLVPEFLAEYPEVTLDILMTDTVIDLMEERADIAIRVGPMRASRLTARKLGESRTLLVASPDYLEHHGTPQTPADLDRHNLIGFSFERLVEGWPFLEGGRIERRPIIGNVAVGDGESARQLALASAGITRLAMFHIGPDIAAGRLKQVLDAFDPGETEAIHAVFIGQGGHLPARVRAVLDFLHQRIKLT